MRITYAPDSICDLVIRTVALVFFVRVVRFDNILASSGEIEYAFRGIIQELRLFPASQQIQAELWVYSKNGTYRFFRLTENGLEEIRQDGEPVKNGEPEAAAGAGGETKPVTGPVTGDTEKPAPGESPSEPPSPANPSDGTGTLPGEDISRNP
jgi:hypothetical protein